MFCAKILGTKAELPPDAALPSTPWHAAQILSATSFPSFKSFDIQIFVKQKKISNTLNNKFFSSIHHSKTNYSDCFDKFGFTFF